MPEPIVTTGSPTTVGATAFASGPPPAYSLRFGPTERSHPHISPAEGLHGRLGLYQLDEGKGHVSYLTRAEAEQMEAEHAEQTVTEPDRGDFHPLGKASASIASTDNADSISWSGLDTAISKNGKSSEQGSAYKKAGENKSKGEKGQPSAAETTAGISIKSQLDNRNISDRAASANGSTEQKSSKELSFDEAWLAGSVNLDSVSPPTHEMIDGRARYESQPKDKNPYGAGVKTGNSTQKDPQERFNAERGLTGPAEVKVATGPDLSKLDRLVSGDLSLDKQDYSEFGGKGKEGKDELREGASGNALLDSADDHEKNSNPHSKGGIALLIDFTPEELEAAKKKGAEKPATEPQKEPEKPFSEKAKEALDFVKNAAQEALMQWAGKASPIPLPPTPPDAETGKNMHNGVTVLKEMADGNYAKQVNKKGGIENPDEEHRYVLPEDVPGWKQITPGLFHTPANPKDGNVDPAEDAEPKGLATDDSHLRLMGLRNSVARPAPDGVGQGVNSSRGFTGSSQSGGDIDMGPDSMEQGYNGPTRTEDPGDVDFNVGAAPLIGLDKGSKSKEEEKQEKGSQKAYSDILKK